MKCESCGMSIEAGPYCEYCVDEDGKLKAFEEKFERFVQWAMEKDGMKDRAEAEAKTPAYMKTMPAWANHPALQE